ncbi:MAG: ScaI family restriction endonuclease [Candidatus Binatia bacterium]
MTSPYKGLPPEKWHAVTQQLVKEHPLKAKEIVEVVLAAWDSIFASKLGTSAFHIGKDIFPKPQIMGFFLHELIPLELAARHPKTWRGEKASEDKDIVYIPDDQYSIEVKTSSNPRHIFGNRSYAQEASENKKVKSGYYLTVNFEKFSGDTKRPNILLVRFGWLDATDWIGQKAATGQQSRLPPEVENYKLLELYKFR